MVNGSSVVFKAATSKEINYCNDLQEIKLDQFFKLHWQSNYD